MARLNHIMLIFAMNALMCVLAEELYSNQYDDVDVQAILQTKDVREEYYNCFMKIAPCKTPKQAELTTLFSEAYQTKCKKCTKKLQEKLEFVIEWYTKNEPDKWELIVAKTVEDMKKKNAD